MGMKKTIEEIWGDLKLGIRTHRQIYPPQYDPNSEQYQSFPTPYHVLNKLKDLQGEHLLDVGMGTGRALKFFHSKNRFKSYTGVELNSQAFQQAQKNLSKTNVHLIQDDVLNLNLDFYDTIFFYNVFEGQTLSSFLLNLKESVERKPREITLIYVDPLFIDQFLANAFKVKTLLKDPKFPVMILSL